MSILEQKTILLVEDDDNSARITARILKGFGFGAIIANTGEAAFEIAISGEKIDLILMDIDLGGGIDGTEAARRILEKRNVPVVFMTAHTEKEYIEKIKEISRYGCVIKNSGVFVLRSSIEMALALFDAHSNIEAKVEEKTRELQKSEYEIKKQNKYHIIITETIRMAYNSDNPGDFLNSVFDIVSEMTGLKSIHVFEDAAHGTAKIKYECKGESGKNIPVEFNYESSLSWKKRLIEESMINYPADKYLPADITRYLSSLEISNAFVSPLFINNAYSGFAIFIGEADEILWEEYIILLFFPIAGILSTAIEKYETAKKIKALLAEKEFILKEVHHRIKNNMNTVAGIMWMQLTVLKDPAAKEALKDARTRVLSMMVLYDKIFRSNDFKEMSFKEYISPLVDEIIGNFPNSGIVRITKSFDDFIIDSERASYLGILINELLTNIMKYAFVGMDSGAIKISSKVLDKKVFISVADNGVGIPGSVDKVASGGFGLQLVEMITHSLRGSIAFERGGGTRFNLEFNL